MYSYSQNFEDVYIYRAFKDVENGFYIDAGAFDPVTDSVTKMLYDIGWSGINLEPGPSFSTLGDRSRDLNLPYALGGEDREAVFRYVSSDPGTSTIVGSSAPNSSQDGSYIVTMVTLETLYDVHVHDRHVHFLKLDVEGGEWEILKTTNWSLRRPELLVVESTLPYTNTRRDAEWGRHLARFGYSEVFFDGVNTYYLREESLFRRQAFFAPINVLDGIRKYDPRQHGVTPVEIAAAEERGRMQHARLTDKRIAETAAELAQVRGEMEASSERHRREWSLLTDSILDLARVHAGPWVSDAQHPTKEGADVILPAVIAMADEISTAQARVVQLTGELTSARNVHRELQQSTEAMQEQLDHLASRLVTTKKSRFRVLEIALRTEEARHDILRAEAAAQSAEIQREVTRRLRFGDEAAAEMLRLHLEKAAQHTKWRNRLQALGKRLTQVRASFEIEMEPLPNRDAGKLTRSSAWQALTRSFTSLSGRALTRHADRFRERNQHDLAAEAYAKASVRLPKRWDLHVQRGNMLKDGGRYWEAEHAYEQALMQQPEQPDTYRQLALLYELAGRPMRADRARRRAEMLRLADAAVRIDHDE